MFLFLLLLALVAFLIGFVTAAKWLLIIAVVLLVIGLINGFGAGWSWRRGP